MIAINKLEIERAKFKEEIYDLKDELDKFKELQKEGEKYKKAIKDLMKRKSLINLENKIF